MNPTNNVRPPFMGEMVWFFCKNCGHLFMEKTKKELIPTLTSSATAKCPKCGRKAKYDKMMMVY